MRFAAFRKRLVQKNSEGRQRNRSTGLKRRKRDFFREAIVNRIWKLWKVFHCFCETFEVGYIMSLQKSGLRIMHGKRGKLPVLEAEGT